MKGIGKYIFCFVFVLLCTNTFSQTSFMGLKGLIGVQVEAKVPGIDQIRTNEGNINMTDGSSFDFGAVYTRFISQRAGLGLSVDYRSLPTVTIERDFTIDSDGYTSQHIENFVTTMNSMSFSGTFSTYREYAPLGGHFSVSFGIRRITGNIYPTYDYTLKDTDFETTSNAFKVANPIEYSNTIPFATVGIGRSYIVKKRFFIDHTIKFTYHFNVDGGSYRLNSSFSNRDIDPEMTTVLKTVLNNRFIPSLHVSFGFLH